MDRRQLLGFLGAVIVGLTAFSGSRVSADDPHAKHAEPLSHCAKACVECSQECDSCYQHCAGLVAEGHKDHAGTMRLCVDCSEICSTAAKLVARQSTLAATTCEACAKACDECAAACGKFPDDKHMARCATACRDCAAACRDMIKVANLSRGAATMNAEPIIVEQTYRAPIGRVWDAISNKDQMPKWFFGSIKEFDPRVGFWTKFNVSNGRKDYLHVWRVVEVVPNRRLTLEWQYGGYPGDSFVTFELTPAGEGTHLKLTHRGHETFPKDDPVFSREHCVDGWNYFIRQQLKTFLDESSGVTKP
jgi:uncharacterized protein YndB with AHSA1/START domain